LTKSSRKNISLTTKLADQKSVKVAIKLPKTLSARRLDDMNETELRHELDSLPTRITEAIKVRDNLFGKLRERWSTAYANDQEFVTAYARAEAAGSEVQVLFQRTVKASRIWNERYSQKLL
jgi:NurA-like 5'-3' nuclease